MHSFRFYSCRFPDTVPLKQQALARSPYGYRVTNQGVCWLPDRPSKNYRDTR